MCYTLKVLVFLPTTSYYPTSLQIYNYFFSTIIVEKNIK